eukprot:s380_g15.t1
MAAAAAFRANKFEEAETLYTEALEAAQQGVQKAAALSSRAQCRLKLKNFEGAREDAQTARALDSENPKAWYRLGVALSALGRLSEAHEALGEALKRRPEDADVHLALRAVLKRQSEGPWDEFKPYRLGGPLRNASEPPMSPLGLPPPYDAIGPAIQAVSAHIHCAVLCADGKAWAWGCGSNDGRCGVERFLNKKGEGKPPEVDMMKCYMMGPHRIGLARPLYWKHPSLQGQQVLMLSTGRNHMAAIALPAGE